MLIAAFYAPHTNLPLPHIQLNQYQLDLMSGLAFHHSVCLLAKHFEKTPLDALYVSTNRTIPIGFVSGLAFNHHSVYTLRLCTLEDTITVHTVASLRPLRGLRFYFPTHLDRIIVITPHLSLSALHHNTPPSGRRTLLRCSWPLNSPMKPPRRLILTIPRVLDAFRKW